MAIKINSCDVCGMIEPVHRINCPEDRDGGKQFPSFGSDHTGKPLDAMDIWNQLGRDMDDVPEWAQQGGDDEEA